ncbi:MAG: hypothetical protein AVDCRST_MAG64-4261 [uncultured Phycisphaerae bacterium]|uniref:Uncharacterized protein n=1 Tax=uncultured Phycisphaerae bacterium TaxID=904963 RepID=A0A6J4QDW9_9BACT|nr:MAG: hypothetical protein AVDCRST_MAG64-4261 [uncultured Phycisphaerae bacterium]
MVEHVVLERQPVHAGRVDALRLAAGRPGVGDDRAADADVALVAVGAGQQDVLGVLVDDGVLDQQPARAGDEPDAVGAGAREPAGARLAAVGPEMHAEDRQVVDRAGALEADRGAGLDQRPRPGAVGAEDHRLRAGAARLAPAGDGLAPRVAALQQQVVGHVVAQERHALLDRPDRPVRGQAVVRIAAAGAADVDRARVAAPADVGEAVGADADGHHRAGLEALAGGRGRCCCGGGAGNRPGVGGRRASRRRLGYGHYGLLRGKARTRVVVRRGAAGLQPDAGIRERADGTLSP